MTMFMEKEPSEVLQNQVSQSKATCPSNMKKRPKPEAWQT